MFKQVVTSFVWVACSSATVGAEPAIVDPMRPPNSGYVRSNPQSKADAGWVVTEILVSADRRLAVVNGRVVKVGNSVNGAKVTAIYGHAVELNANGKTVLLAPVALDIKRETKR